MRESVATERLAAHGVKEVPFGWEVSKVKYLADYINGYAFKPNDWETTGKPIIRIQDLSNPDSTPNRYEGTLDSCYEVNKGDFLISWSASLGLFVWKGEDAWLNQHIFKVVLNEKRLKRSFFSWLATWFMEELGRDTHGSTMQHLTKDAFGGFPVILPPLETQTKIGDYLDRKTAELGQLIAAKKNLLKLLDEKKRALIARAATRGLNPDAPLKDSGIPWLGMIPEHWEVERSKWLLPEIDERSETGEEELLTVSHLTGVTKRRDKDVNMFMAESLEGYKKCNKDDLVINTLWAWMGAMGVSPVDGVISPAYNVYRPTERLLSEYLDMLVRMSNFISEITRYSKGVWSSRLRLYPEGLYEAHLPVPPLEEQREIVEGVNNKLSDFKELKSVTEKTISLLQERRMALISAAVTGKLSEEVLNGG